MGFGVGARAYLARGKHASEVGHVVHLVRVRVRARVRARVGVGVGVRARVEFGGHVVHPYVERAVAWLGLGPGLGLGL